MDFEAGPEGKGFGCEVHFDPFRWKVWLATFGSGAGTLTTPTSTCAQRHELKRLNWHFSLFAQTRECFPGVENLGARFRFECEASRMM